MLSDVDAIALVLGTVNALLGHGVLRSDIIPVILCECRASPSEKNCPGDFSPL